MGKLLPKPWRVGNANDPKEDDARFESEQDAVDVAQALALGEHWDDFVTPYAVWNHRDEIVHLFFRGQQFRNV